MTTYDIPKINPADLAEHRGTSGTILQEGQPFLYLSHQGPFHTEYGTSWLFRGKLKNGNQFTCFLPDNSQRQEQLEKLREQKHYMLLKIAWRGFDDQIKHFYKFEAVKGF